MANETLGTLDIKIKIDWKKVDKSLKKVSTSAQKAGSKMFSAMKSSFTGFLAIGRKVTNTLVGVFSSAFTKIVNIIKKAMLVAGVAMTALFAISVKNATKQEDALFSLAVALSLTGDSSKEALDNYKAFASQLQKTTVIGDEQTLALLAQHKQLGVVTKDLKKAALMTIGIAAATNKSTDTISLYVASALQGETAMLARYIPALKGVSDSTKAMAIITKFAAKGMKVAEGRAKTTSGAMKQMKNAIGDVTEVIGKPFLSGILKSSNAIKKFAEDNSDKIAAFSQLLSDKLGQVLIKLLPIIKRLSNDFVTFLKSEEFVDKMANGLKNIKNAFVIIVQSVKKAIGLLREWVKEGEGIKDMKDMMSSLVSSFKNFLPLIKAVSEVALIVGNLFKVINFVFFGFINLIDKAVSGLSNFLRNLLGISGESMPNFIKVIDKGGESIQKFIINALKIGSVILQYKLLKGILTKPLATIGLLKTGVKALWEILTVAFSGIVTGLGLVTTASAGIVTLLSTLAALGGWFIGKGLDSIFKFSDGIAWLIIQITKLINLIPGINIGGIGTFGSNGDPNAIKSKDIGSIMSRKASNIPVANPVAVSTANAGKGVSAGEKVMIAQLKQLTQVTAGAPAKESLISSNFSA